MNDTIKIWENSEFGTVRTVEIDGEPWLVGKDVAEVLGYSNTRDALIRHVDEEDKNTVVNPDGNKGNPNMVVINESGLYALVFRSKLPWAKKFQHWVTSEVLPSIRKHGMYAIDDLINNPELGVRAFTALMEERQKTKALEAKVAEKQEQITELTPKATYCDVVLMSDDLVSVTEIAKDYGKSAQWLNKLLHDMENQHSGSINSFMNTEFNLISAEFGIYISRMRRVGTLLPVSRYCPDETEKHTLENTPTGRRTAGNFCMNFSREKAYCR